MTAAKLACFLFGFIGYFIFLIHDCLSCSGQLWPFSIFWSSHRLYLCRILFVALPSRPFCLFYLGATNFILLQGPAERRRCCCLASACLILLYSSQVSIQTMVRIQWDLCYRNLSVVTYYSRRRRNLAMYHLCSYLSHVCSFSILFWCSQARHESMESQILKPMRTKALP